MLAFSKFRKKLTTEVIDDNRLHGKVIWTKTKKEKKLSGQQFPSMN